MSGMDVDVSRAVEVVKERLYYVVLRSPPSGDRPDAHFFTVDDVLHYWAFFLDYGPLSLGNLYRFCQLVSTKLGDKSLAGRRLYLYSGPHMHRRHNAVYLLASYSLLFLGRSPEEAMRPFANLSPSLAPWHDASPTVDTFHLTTLDVLRGIARARDCRFFSFESFDIEQYEHYEKVENGDMNWIVEGRFLAFAGPHDTRTHTVEGYHTTAVEDVVPYFKARGVTAVIRLNKKYYNERRFTTAGIDHHEMYYLDGSNPPEHVLQRFLAVTEATPGAVAVHCKAGLGRTGTCIGAYLMKHYRFTAREVIGWMRVCRPGSVIGPQQQFLEDIQGRMWEEGEAFRVAKRLPMPVPTSLLGRWQAAQVMGVASGMAHPSPRADGRGGTTSPPSTSTTMRATTDMLSSLTLSSGPGVGGRAVASGVSAVVRASSSRTVTMTVAGTASSFSATTVEDREVWTGRDTPGTPLSMEAKHGMGMHGTASTMAGGAGLPAVSGGGSPSGATALGGGGGYASPGSSPIATGVLSRARSRAAAATSSSVIGGGTPPAAVGGDDGHAFRTGAGAMPSYYATSTNVKAPSVSPLTVGGGGPSSSSTAAPATPVRGVTAVGHAPMLHTAATTAAFAASQGDLLRSAKTRSPGSVGGTPGGSGFTSVSGSVPTTAGGLRYAGVGVLSPTAPTTPKSPGFGGYGDKGAPALSAGPTTSPSSSSRFTTTRLGR